MTVNLNKSNVPLSKNKRPAKGDKIVFSDRHGGNPGLGHKVGDVVEVVKTDARRLDGGYTVTVKGDPTQWGYEWFNLPDVEPKQILATLSHDTSREYAKRATSRLLDDEHNKVLKDAAAGREIDVIAFQKALVQSFSAASTRYGQSPQRRKACSELRHLSYWAAAIIDQVVQELPVYEAGARSPRIAELEAEVLKLRTEGSDEVRAALSSAKSTIDHQNRQIEAISGSFRASKDRANAEIARLNGIVGGATKALAEVENERDTIASVLAYVVQHGDTLLVSRVLGYWDGLEDA